MILSFPNISEGLACHCWCYPTIRKYILTLMFGSCCFRRNASLFTSSHTFIKGHIPSLLFSELVCQPMPRDWQARTRYQKWTHRFKWWKNCQLSIKFWNSTSWGLKLCNDHFLTTPKGYYQELVEWMGIDAHREWASQLAWDHHSIFRSLRFRSLINYCLARINSYWIKLIPPKLTNGFL